MPRLTSRILQLYNRAGKGAAASAISTAVTTATKSTIRRIGRKYNFVEASRIISNELFITVFPVQKEWLDWGACDTEPNCTVKSEIVHRISKRYGLDQFDSDELYYSI